MAAPWPCTVQCLGARATGPQGLPARRSQTWAPQGVLRAAWLGPVRKPADVVPCTLLLRAAEVTRLRQETVPDCPALSVHLLGLLAEEAMTVPPAGAPAKPGAPRCLARSACGGYCPHHSWAMRQRLYQGSVPHAVPLPPPLDGNGPQGGEPPAALLCVVLGHEAGLRRLETRGPVRRWAVSPRARRGDRAGAAHGRVGPPPVACPPRRPASGRRPCAPGCAGVSPRTGAAGASHAGTPGAGLAARQRPRVDHATRAAHRRQSARTITGASADRGGPVLASVAPGGVAGERRRAPRRAGAAVRRGVTP
jgi:hypothetical protein